MSAVAIVMWVEVALLACAFGFGLAARVNAGGRGSIWRNVHLTFAVPAVIGIVVLALLVTPIVSH